MTKEYVCECGKVFDVPQKFNGHKSHCPVHLQLTGNLEKRKELDKSRGQLLASRAHVLAQEKKEREIQQWISEKHICERCGKVMTEKFGTGRFCSRSCANAGRKKSNHSKEAKERAAIRGKIKQEINIKEYLNNPKVCTVCGAPLSYDRRNRKTCSDKCAHELIGIKSSISAARHGGNNNEMGVRGTARHGVYKGVHCDSSYELAFLIYCIDHNINISRNVDGFPYLYKGKYHKYYPDFKINNSYIEIKNYRSDIVQAKIDCLPKNISYHILYLDDIRCCIEYCVNTYGKDFTSLYDKRYPSWLDRTK